ncbi:MAG: hypothetical protein D6737_04690 [Chloroflexi bacterium]|nr:MAG: hypothetical protein D6737_04690 [Chloroflexota bacterium]
MRESEAIIERVRHVNSTHQRLELTIDERLRKIKPGQSLLARPRESYDPYLREQWWPVAVRKGKLIVERPNSTVYQPGQTVSLLAPMGKPFGFRRVLRNVLLIAYDTPPTPLLMPIEWLLVNDVSVTLLLLGEAAEYDTAHLQEEVEIITGDSDMNWDGRVTTVGWADQVFVVVAQDDELGRFRAVRDLFHALQADVPKKYLWGVFTPIAPCGVGACMACIVRIQGGNTLICKDGPALDLEMVKLE